MPLVQEFFTAAAAVTKSDTTEVRFTALWIGDDGDVTITTLSDQVVTFKAVPVGLFRVAGKKVMSTNTSAADIVALS